MSHTVRCFSCDGEIAECGTLLKCVICQVRDGMTEQTRIEPHSACCHVEGICNAAEVAREMEREQTKRLAALEPLVPILTELVRLVDRASQHHCVGGLAERTNEAAERTAEWKAAWESARAALKKLEK